MYSSNHIQSSFGTLANLEFLFRKNFFVILLLVFSLVPLRAAEIEWGVPQSITGTLTDFDLDGELVHAWNGGGTELIIGAGTLDLQFFPGPDLENGPYGSADPHSRGEDLNYESLLSSMTFGGDTESLYFSGLSEGASYRVQIWLADTRDRTQHRQKTYDSGVGSASVVLDSGPPSEYVIGNFVADSSLQEIRFVGATGATHPQYNAIMLREIGPPIPEIEQLSLSVGVLTSDKGVWVDEGESVVVEWSVNAADEIVLNPGNLSLASAGSLQLFPLETQEYILECTNENGVVEQSITVFVGESVLPVRLNEILVSNSRSIEDEDGDREDWIELFNPNPFALAMHGYSLTDDPTYEESWDIPDSQIIPAYGYVLLFASDKDRQVGELHTDFKLSSDGEYLALLKDGFVSSQWPAGYPDTTTFPKIKEDFSYGVGSSGELMFYDEPSPGSENGEGFIGYLEVIDVSLLRGVYDTEQTIEIISPNEGTGIWYTTDGSLPTESNGVLYESPIEIDTTMVFRAVGYLDGYAPSDIVTHTYIFPEDVVRSDVMDASITESSLYSSRMESSLLSLPSISLSIPEFDSLDNSVERLTSVEYLPIDGSDGFQVDAGITNFGGYFTDFDKKSFRLYFRKEYGPGKLKYPLYEGFENGMPVVDEFDALDLRSGSHDMSMRGAYLSNRFTDDSMLEMGHFNPHGRFVHLYINGVYWGQYHLRERWAAAMAAEYFGGDKDDYEAINGNGNVGSSFGEGVPYDGDGSGWEYIKQLGEGDTPWEELPARVDLDSYIDFMLLFAAGSCEFEYRSINQPVDGGVGMQIYLNDADGFLRSISGGKAGEDGPGGLLGGLKDQAHPDFMMYLADRIQKQYLGNGALAPEQMIARLQKHIDATELSFLSESARWGYRTPASWRDYQDNLIENDLPTRASTMIAAFRGEGLFPSFDAPVYSQDGGDVYVGFGLVVSNLAGGTTYFTTNGEDPRLLGGAVNSNANAIVEDSNILTLVEENSTWRFLDDGSDQGIAWVSGDFDDSTWLSGFGEFGYGDGDEETVVSYGSSSNDKHATTYFRKEFSVSDLSEISILKLGVVRDDGVVVYLNGEEVYRNNMPTGEITSSTFANGVASGGGESSYLEVEVTSGLLNVGSNVIAVEIHQSTSTSSDISFNLRLDAFMTADLETSYVFTQGATVVKARTLREGEWSALREEAFLAVGDSRLPSEGDLSISEIHYHPLDPTTSELEVDQLLGSGDFEYLELINLSDDTLNVGGCYFGSGIEYTLPLGTILASGERLVVCSNLVAFALRHEEGGLLLVGDYEGALGNGGDELSLLDSSGGVLIDLTYGDSSNLGWPSQADGDGRSLVLISPQGTGNASDALSWRSSFVDHGTPGSSDGVTLENGLEDFDGDGYPLLIEKVLLSSDEDARSLPEIEKFFVLDDDGFERLHIRVMRNLSVEASLEVHSSQDLVDWSNYAALVSRVQVNEMTESLEFVMLNEGGEAVEKEFIRIFVR